MIVAHVFLAPYTLPVPFWLYLYGCAAALVLSFALLAYLSTAAPRIHRRHRELSGAGAAPGFLWQGIVAGLRAGAVAALALAISAGYWGPADPGANVGMTIFWVWFLLAYVYLTALVGDLYPWINPWRTLASGVALLGVDIDRPRVRYPRAMEHWPAVVF